MASRVSPCHHTGRNSSRHFFSTTTPLFKSQRTLCPRDTNAFSYDPAHLREWYMPQELWDALPQQMQRLLAAFQHAGAAVLTGFNRLADMGETVPELSQPIDSDSDDALEDVSSAAHEVVAAKLLDHQRKSSRNSREDDEYFPCSPILPSRDYASSFSSDSSSGFMTRSNSTSVPSPLSLPLSPGSHISPFALSPVSPTPIFSRRLSTTKFAHHHNTPMAQYLAELYHLRHETLVRLRHAVRRVETEWQDVRRVSMLRAYRFCIEDSKQAKLDPHTESKLEQWWTGKRTAVHELTHTANALGHGLNISLGWGGNGGMGWA